MASYLELNAVMLAFSGAAPLACQTCTFHRMYQSKKASVEAGKLWNLALKVTWYIIYDSQSKLEVQAHQPRCECCCRLPLYEYVGMAVCAGGGRGLTLLSSLVFFSLMFCDGTFHPTWLTDWFDWPASQWVSGMLLSLPLPTGSWWMLLCLAFREYWGSD